MPYSDCVGWGGANPIAKRVIQQGRCGETTVRPHLQGKESAWINRRDLLLDGSNCKDSGAHHLDAVLLCVVKLRTTTGYVEGVRVSSANTGQDTRPGHIPGNWIARQALAG